MPPEPHQGKPWTPYAPEPHLVTLSPPHLVTRAEAFGIAAVEASSTGLPVIATNVGGLSDIVVDGKTGFLIPPDDKDALTKSLHILLNSPNLRRCRRAHGHKSKSVLMTIKMR